jgi:hypothetical protein
MEEDEDKWRRGKWWVRRRRRRRSLEVFLEEWSSLCMVQPEGETEERRS